MDWSPEDMAEYLGKISAVATAIETKGSKVKLSPAFDSKQRNNNKNFMYGNNL